MTLHRKHHIHDSPLPPSSSLSPSSHSPSAHNGNEHAAAPSIDDLRATLSTILPLLNAFNHRHRNQHRSSSWWSTFGIFRRSLVKLTRALEYQIPNRGGSGSSSSSSSKKRHGIDDVSTRVTWLNNHLLPRAFVAFSQLMTDNQHAPLGLFLLAILGQVHHKCAKWLPPPPATGKPRPAQPEHAAPTAQPREEPGGSRSRKNMHDDDVLHVEALDRGTTISRTTFLGAAESNAHTTTALTKRELKSKTGTGKPVAHRCATVADSSGGNGVKGKVRKKEKKKGDTLSSIFGSLA
ncbi:hypothetical protein E4U21_003810 [Claviceps maximensis]|nr:hypothetical protein E4U21_003810 [Claviceps maximensis]